MESHFIRFILCTCLNEKCDIIARFANISSSFCSKYKGLPSKFCESHLPPSVLGMTLEDESGKEFEATYIGKRAGLSGGWRAFALDHKLDDGDALVFELIESTRFKVHPRLSVFSTPLWPKGAIFFL